MVSRSVSWLEIFPRHSCPGTNRVRESGQQSDSTPTIPLSRIPTLLKILCVASPPRSLWIDSSAFSALPRPGSALLAKQSLFDGWIHSETCFYCRYLVMRLWRGDREPSPTSALKRQRISTQSSKQLWTPADPPRLGTRPAPDRPHHHRPPKSKPLLLVTQRVWGKSHNPSHGAL